jgi:hypothetical protein
MKTYTMEDILAEGPCEDNYPIDRLVELAAGRDQITPREIADLDIPINDKICILSRLLYRTSPHTANRISRLIALDVVDRWNCPDVCYWYLMTDDTKARAVDTVDTVEAVEARWEAEAAWAAARAAEAWWAAEAAAWAAARAAEAMAEEAALEKYLAWIVRAWEVHP